ncbi:MAG TPA: phosphoribosyltransferase family protein [Terriglobales bacterium]|jgi:hypoxanthine phosphoribosyltransferase
MPAHPTELQVLHSADEIAARVQDLAARISRDYAGKELHLVCVLENAFVFAADLVRELSGDVLVSFVRSDKRQLQMGDQVRTEIFFAPQADVRGHHILMVEGLIASGQTSDFLARTFLSRGAASVKHCALMSRKNARTTQLEPEYVAFELEGAFVVGYGLGDPYGRNLGYLAAGDRQ